MCIQWSLCMAQLKTLPMSIPLKDTTVARKEVWTVWVFDWRKSGPSCKLRFGIKKVVLSNHFFHCDIINIFIFLSITHNCCWCFSGALSNCLITIHLKTNKKATICILIIFQFKTTVILRRAKLTIVGNGNLDSYNIRNLNQEFWNVWKCWELMVEMYQMLGTKVWNVSKCWELSLEFPI